MAGARYLVRFDDLCPTMSWSVWDRVEAILEDSGVRPILAVVPDNRDPKLDVEPARPDFWDRVRSWRDRGWAIGLHGWRHLYETRDAGMVGLNDYSEFAGLDRSSQAHKMRNALAVFEREGVQPDLWIAPAHSFDTTTVEVLVQLGIRVISDGLTLYPHTDAGGVTWIPQQMWQFRKMPLGVWTVCFHHNPWTDADVERLRSDLRDYRDRITSLPEEVDRYRQRDVGLSDACFGHVWRCLIRARKRGRAPSDRNGHLPSESR